MAAPTNKTGIVHGKVLEDSSVKIKKLDTSDYTPIPENPKDLVTIEYLTQIIQKIKNGTI